MISLSCQLEYLSCILSRQRWRNVIIMIGIILLISIFFLFFLVGTIVRGPIHDPLPGSPIFRNLHPIMHFTSFPNQGEHYPDICLSVYPSIQFLGVVYMFYIYITLLLLGMVLKCPTNFMQPRRIFIIISSSQYNWFGIVLYLHLQILSTHDTCCLHHSP